MKECYSFWCKLYRAKKGHCNDCMIKQKREMSKAIYKATQCQTNLQDSKGQSKKSQAMDMQ